MNSKWAIPVAVVAIFQIAAPYSPAWAAASLLHQTTIDAFHHWSDKDLGSLIKKPNVSVDLSDHEFFFIDTIMRDKSAMVEVHDRWNDYLVIQEGDGVLAYGGKVANLKQGSPGEWRGDMMAGGESVTVHAGDLVVIPAGTAHQMRLEAGKTIRYLAFKARQ